MNAEKKKIKRLVKAGFSLIEIMLAIALSAIFLPAMITAFSFSIQSASQGENYSLAYSLGQEQMEAIYVIKEQEGPEWNWQETPLPTSEGEYYQPFRSGEIWRLGNPTNNPVEVNGFTKMIKIEEIRRNNDGEYDQNGFAVDQDSRLITVFVTWLENGRLQEINLESIVTNH